MERQGRQPSPTGISGRITRLVPRGRTGERIAIYLNDTFAGEISAEVAAQQGLAVGQELDAASFASLLLRDEQKQALDAALRLIAARPRSAHEIRQRLQRKGFSTEAIDQAVAKLQEWRYVDDATFATLWVQSRQQARGRRRLLQELREKGVAPELAEAVLPTADDELAAARQFVAKQAPRLTQVPKRVARRRLAGMLERRGFSWQTIRTVLREVGIAETLDDEPET
ncbi:regulatory protein RecX [Thermorudis peleae]|uniref:regulatory protein RecX n=1 Tax=Thermorudis peleae TaxID=1382356 RepID=UPI000689783F|nr:RecX family transcriptional regulator [Thermorudis peleae]